MPDDNSPARAVFHAAQIRSASGALLLLAILAPLHTALAQTTDSTRAETSPVADSGTSATALDSLVVRALAVSPSVKAAVARVEAARRRVTVAGTPPDPMLMLGVQNLPLGKEAGMSGVDPMTMKMVGVEQRVPYPGKLSLQRRAAAGELESLQAALVTARRQVVRDVKDAWYELAFIDQALAIVEQNRDVLTGLIRVTETRYGVGASGQQDVLRARVEATRLAETAATLTEQRRTALARLNALLDRPSGAPVQHAAVPARITRAAVAASPDAIRFTSAALGARAADSPLPPLEELQEAAIRDNPELGEHEAMISAQAARLQLARKTVLPDIDLSLQYGQRSGGLPDMVSAFVSIPLPVFKSRKQDQLVAEASAQLEVLHAEHQQKLNELRAEVARLASEVERSRSQLALYVKALLPQARASLGSAMASYQVGRVEFLTVLDDQATVFNYETDYYRALTDFAKNIAELERVVGKEILP